MSVTLHGDLLYIWSIPTLFLEGVIDPYQWAVQHYPLIAQSDWDVYYPPTTYIVNGIWLAMFRLFSPGLIDWLIQSRELTFSLVEYPLTHYLRLRSDLVFTWSDLLTLKFPYLMYEMILVLGLVRLLKPRQQIRGLILWGLNPIVIYSTYMMGQVDILTAALVVWAIVLSVENKKMFSMTLLVIGTMVKVLPVVLIAPLAFILGTSWKQRISLVISAVAIFVVLNLPFSADKNRLYIAYVPPVMPSFFDVVLRPDAIVMTGKLIAAMGVGMWLGWNIVKRTSQLKLAHSPKIMAFALLVFFSAYRGALFNHYMVLLPLLVLLWIDERRGIVKMVIFTSLLFLTHIYTRPLQGELFTPLGVSWLTNLPSTRELVSQWFQYEHLSLVTGAVLSGWMLREVVSKGSRLFK